MKLLLVRHGNTFEPNEQSYWVGRSNDLPLSKSGIIQIEKLSQLLINKNLFPNQIICSELQRTYQTAEIIKDKLNLNLDIKVDQRLNEIDYGFWSGLTNNQIIDRFGKEELLAWQEKSIWPQNANWQESEEILIEKIKNLVSLIADQSSSSSTIMLVTSNGIIRYFLKLIPELWESYISIGKFKVATGSVSVIEKQNQNWKVIAWNES